MKTIGFAAIAAIAALVLGFGARMSAPSAYADTTGVSSVGCELLAAGIDGDTTDATAAGDYGDACDGISAAEVDDLADALGDEDGTLEQSDLDAKDILDGNQLNENCFGLGFQCTIVGFVWVDDEAAVTVDPPAGLQTAEGGTIDWVCDTEAEDADCADVVANDGDGVVTFGLFNDTADAGDVKTVNVEQEAVAQSFDVTLVGDAHDVTLTLLESVIQSNGSASAAAACSTDTDVEDDSLSSATTTIGIAVVIDRDDTELARVTVAASSDDEDIAVIAVGDNATGIVGDTGQTVDAGANGIASFFVVCGGKTTGDAVITATINEGDADEDSDDADLTVVGEPASIALTASPAAIACDGSATSTVTAKVTDSAGDNVANGTSVNFSVVALGTANPINADTADGSASTTVTPLSGATAGVTVIVTAGDAQASIRVDCSLPIPTVAPPAPTPTGGRGTIGGPDTGNGGFLGQDGSAGFPMWTLVALALGSAALAAGGMVTRRAGK
ncbi:MAG: hypothetical protein HY874_11735 [Chloroflexi bacterium]|nr:hypothetical protein [Chloroflexota bacterium]